MYFIGWSPLTGHPALVPYVVSRIQIR